jgi:hypothetical protein
MRTGVCRTMLVAVVAVVAEVGHASAGAPPTIVDLGAFPGYSTTARGINDAGVIVGEMYRSINEDSNESHGLLWRKDASGQFVATKIDDLADFPNSYPRGINSSGRIGGWAEVADFWAWGPPAQAVMWEEDAWGSYAPTDLGTPYGFCVRFSNIRQAGGRLLRQTGVFQASYATNRVHQMRSARQVLLHMPGLSDTLNVALLA